MLLNCHLKIFLANLTLTRSVQKYQSNSLGHILHPVIVRNESDNLKNGSDVEKNKINEVTLGNLTYLFKYIEPNL